MSQMPTNSEYVNELRATVIGYGVSEATADALIRAAGRDGYERCQADLAATLNKRMDEHDDEDRWERYHAEQARLMRPIPLPRRLPPDVPPIAEPKTSWLDRALSYVGPYGPF